MTIQDIAIRMFFDFCWSLVVFSTLQSSIRSIFYLGKSKTALKKLRKQYTFFEWFRLKHVKDEKDNCIRHKKALLVFLQLRNIYIGILCLTLLLHLLALMHILSAEIWWQYLILKWCTIDAACGVYELIMTKRDIKRGRVTWRWEQD